MTVVGPAMRPEQKLSLVSFKDFSKIFKLDFGKQSFFSKTRIIYFYRSPTAASSVVEHYARLFTNTNTPLLMGTYSQ